ncbi:MAG: hypothetical protein AAGF30_03155 [Pseudomonadota bacterium]
MPRIALALAIGALAVATPAAAEGVFVPPPDFARVDPDLPPLTGARANVQRQLPRFGYHNVDVRRLSTAQVSAINSLVHSDEAIGDIRIQIRSALRPGIIQQQYDRLRDRR